MVLVRLNQHTRNIEITLSPEGGSEKEDSGSLGRESGHILNQWVVPGGLKINFKIDLFEIEALESEVTD